MLIAGQVDWDELLRAAGWRCTDEARNLWTRDGLSHYARPAAIQKTVAEQEAKKYKKMMGI